MPVAKRYSHGSRSIEKRFSCGSLVTGLEAADCDWLSTIGMFAQGINSQSDNGIIWLGNSGPNVFSIGNIAAIPLTVVVWYQNDNPIDYGSSFMAARQPYITYSLEVGQTFEISLANGVSGGMAAVDRGVTTLTPDGQIFQTWVEFTTGNYATMDITREVNMGGDHVNAITSGSGGNCGMSVDQCAYVCNTGNQCGTAGSYTLLDCLPGSQAGAAGAFVDGEWTGGCQGWSNGGSAIIAFSTN